MLPIKIELPEGFLQEETRCEFTVPTSMKKVWAVELDLLNELLRVCRKYDIEVFCFGGTALGAARHKGFIPWDDDIDLVATRSNYDKLCACAAEEFQYPYFFQTDKTDPGSMRGHAQLRNSETTGILKNELALNIGINQGIFIDIFPLDEIPDALDERNKYLNCLERHRSRAFRAAVCTGYRPFPDDAGFKTKIKKAICMIGRPLDRLLHINLALSRSFSKKMTAYDGLGMKEVGLMPLVASARNLIYPRDHFEKGVTMLDFEFMKVPVSPWYEELLTSQYGNWHKFVVGTSIHGGVVFEPEKPYRQYLNDCKR